MKTLSRLSILFMAIFCLIISSCEKETSENNPSNQNDTITLKLVDVILDSSVVQIIPDCEIEINYEITGTFFNGPHEYQATKYTIKSRNPDKLKISYGHTYFLGQDSIINNSLYWISEYVSGGMSVGGPIGYRTNYVGLKLEDGARTMYGWLHTPTAGQVERFAFDTTGTATIIFAGQDKGIR